MTHLLLLLLALSAATPPAEARCRRPPEAEGRGVFLPSADAGAPVGATGRSPLPVDAAQPAKPATGSALGDADDEDHGDDTAARAAEVAADGLASPPPAALHVAAAEAEAAADPTPSAPAPTATFSIAAGESLRAALARWTAGSGWELAWDAPTDYSISAPAQFSGSLAEAVGELMDSLRANGAPYGAEIWQGNRVVRVTRVR